MQVEKNMPSLINGSGNNLAMRMLIVMYEEEAFKNATGCKIGDCYSLPRIKKEVTINGMVFPHIVFNKGEAIDRFCGSTVHSHLFKNYFRRVGTMIPASSENQHVNDKRNYHYYMHEAYIRVKDFEKVDKALNMPAKRLGLFVRHATFDLRLQFVSECMIQEMNNWHLDKFCGVSDYQTRMAAIGYIRQHVIDRMDVLINKDVGEKHKNLLIGMIRYHVGHLLDDFSGD